MFSIRVLAKSVFFSLLIIFPHLVFAASGGIDSANHYAWNNNGGWVNWNPTNGNVQVTDTALTGYIWSANFGWLNLSPTNGGVTNNGQGVLGGFAWGADTGWIDFNGVTIDSSGVFHGQTTAQSIFGIMTFDCTNCSTQTAWRPSTSSGVTTSGGGNGAPLSGPFSFGYSASSATTSTSLSTWVTSDAIPPSLTPKTPPPSIQPTTRPPSSGSQAAPLASGISLIVSADQSATVGRPILLSIRVVGATPRSKATSLETHLYSATGAAVYSSSRTLRPADPSQFVENIPTDDLSPATYTIAVTAQYGTTKPTTQPLRVVLLAKSRAPVISLPGHVQLRSAAPPAQCAWFGACAWRSVVEFFTRLFTR